MNAEKTPRARKPRSPKKPAAVPSTKAGTVALIGRPNVGKSTLLNRLLGQKVAIVSDKPQTTRISLLGIKTTDKGQIVFIDNPGIHKPLHKLNKRMMSYVDSSLETADIVCLLVDATLSFGQGDAYVLDMLGRTSKPVFLLINKVDAVRKDRLLPMIDKYKDLHPFKDIIPISALKGTNLDVLERLLLEALPPGGMIYPGGSLSDQSERFYLAELIREKLLARVEMELPFVTAVYIDRVERRAAGADSGRSAGEETRYKPESPAPEDEAADSVSLWDEEEGALLADEGSAGSGRDAETEEAGEAGTTKQPIREALPDRPPGHRQGRLIEGRRRRDLPLTYVQASIFVEKPNHRQIVIGREGQVIKAVGIEARRDMERYLKTRVYLDLQVKVRPRWRDSADVLDLIEGQK